MPGKDAESPDFREDSVAEEMIFSGEKDLFEQEGPPLFFLSGTAPAGKNLETKLLQREKQYENLQPVRNQGDR